VADEKNIEKSIDTRYVALYCRYVYRFIMLSIVKIDRTFLPTISKISFFFLTYLVGLEGMTMPREYVTELERDFFYSGKKLPDLYLKYLHYEKNVHKLELGGLQNRKNPILKFIVDHPGKNAPSTIGRLTRSEVQEYTMNSAAKLSRNMKRNLVISLRSFFRFLHLYEYTKIDLSKSVPMIVAHRMATVPRGMPWKAVEKILSTINRKNFSGKRDYALILTLARYGVRSSQIRDLRIKDIDWKKKTIFFAGKKNGKDVIAPLYQDVANALIQYFKGGRKNAPPHYENVFLKTGTGGSQISGQVPMNASIWNIVNRRLRDSGHEGIIEHARGPHAIRHAFASKLLEENMPIKNIADLLGHASLNTTFIYTKVSIKKMLELSHAWPEKV